MASSLQARPFDIRDEIGYTCGDMAGSFVNIYIEGYFLTFCTYVTGINPQWMAMLFLAARLLDACLGPVIGSLPDHFHLGTSRNKFLPWVRLFSAPLAVSGVLCFLSVPFQGNVRFIWAAGCYLLYNVCYSGASIPYGAMVNVVSPNPSDRARLSRARSIGGTLVNFGALSLVPVLCFDKDANLLPRRFTMLAVVFGICCLIGYELLGRLTLERVHENSSGKESYPMNQLIRAALKNRPLVGIMVATIGAMMISSSMQLSSYIYKEFYRNTSAMTAGSLLNLPILFICFPLIPRLSERMGKRKLVLCAIAFGFIVNLFKLVFCVRNVWVFMILYCLSNGSQTVFNMLIWAMVADCLDYGEWKFHIRSDGGMYGLYVFSRKLGSTIASSGGAAALSAIGYVAGNNVIQTEAVVHGIYYVVNGIPVLVCLIELVGLGLIYNLDRKLCSQMYADLARLHD